MEPAGVYDDRHALLFREGRSAPDYDRVQRSGPGGMVRWVALAQATGDLKPTGAIYHKLLDPAVADWPTEVKEPMARVTGAVSLDSPERTQRRAMLQQIRNSGLLAFSVADQLVFGASNPEHRLAGDRLKERPVVSDEVDRAEEDAGCWVTGSTEPDRCSFYPALPVQAAQVILG